MSRRATKTPSEKLRDEVNKMLGEEVLTLGNDKRHIVTYMPTGLLPIDILLQGGIPRGRFVAMTGAYSTLKSFIGLHTIAQVQKAGGTCALIDTEHAYDPKWAEELGVDTLRLMVLHPETGELAIDAADLLVRARVDLIVFDSIAATLPQQEAAKRMHKEHDVMARQAALMSKACRRLTTANSGQTGFLWINQLRDQIGVMFGPTERAPGGRAMGYYASILVNIRKAGKITRDLKTFTGDKYAATKEEIGQTFRAIVEKSKLNRPFREVFFDFRLQEPAGIDIAKFLFAQGVEYEIIERRGNTWHFGGHKVLGKDKFLALLNRNQKTREKLEDELRAHHGLPPILRRGSLVIAKKRAGASKRSSSSASTRKRTLTLVPAKSSTTAAQKTTSSKLRMPRKSTR